MSKRQPLFKALVVAALVGGFLLEDIRPWGAAGALRAPPRRLGRRGVPGPLGRPWNRRPRRKAE